LLLKDDGAKNHSKTVETTDFISSNIHAKWGVSIFSPVDGLQ